MRSRIAMTLALALAAGVTLCGPVSAQAPPRQRMVIVISLDGFPAYALEDAQLPIPTLRRLIRQGVTARMTTINPTITWPNHTTLVTGVHADEHGLLVNGSLVPTGTWPPIKVDPMIDKVKMVHAPTVYDAAHKAGLTTAQIDWVAINNAPTITWPFSEWATPEGAVEQEGNDPQRRRRRRRRHGFHQGEHPVPRPDLDQGGGASHSRAPAQPDAVALPLARFRTPSIRPQDPGRNQRHGVSG
ncbi:MAG: alkaline phosphatase family protein [Candidatus Solibacter sp.]|nr:alkaline phosphatase family protein [Candidatus Solibacter sp.]